MTRGSLITLTTLIVQSHVPELRNHMKEVRRLGFTLPQLEEVCLHLVYYVGFHVTHLALHIARDIFAGT